jgi:hypothetical protein
MTITINPALPQELLIDGVRAASKRFNEKEVIWRKALVTTRLYQRDYDAYMVECIKAVFGPENAMRECAPVIASYLSDGTQTKALQDHYWAKSLDVGLKQKHFKSPFALLKKFESEEEYQSYLKQKVGQHAEMECSLLRLSCSLPIGLKQHHQSLTELSQQHFKLQAKWKETYAENARYRDSFVLANVIPFNKMVGFENSFVKGFGTNSFGKGVTIGLYELGDVDTSHPLLTSRVVCKEKPDGLVSDHATHVAGIIAQLAPKARIYSYYVPEVKNVKQIPKEVQIINVSVSFNPKLVDVCKVFNHLLGLHRIVVKSLDNEGSDVTLDNDLGEGLGPLVPINPLSKRSLLVMGILPDGITPADYTNLPGENYWENTVCAPEKIRSSLPGNKYGVMRGTSMAAPVVSAILATIMSLFPMLSKENAVKAVKYGSVPIVVLEDGTYKAETSQNKFSTYPKDVQLKSRRIWGWGRADLPGALRAAKKLISS